MLRHQFLVAGAPIPDTVIVEIVDEVLLPLFHSHPNGTAYPPTMAR